MAIAHSTMGLGKFIVLLGCIIWSFIAAAVQAADYPVPAEGDWTVRDFRFHTGEVLPELRLHYTTVCARTGEPVLILHGTGHRNGQILETGSGTVPARCSARGEVTSDQPFVPMTTLPIRKNRDA